MAEYVKSINLIKVADGAPGSPGRPMYTWIAYAEDERGNGINSSPMGMSYIGFAYNKPSSTPNYSDPSLYTWSLYVGKDGEKGEPGRDGEGVNTYSLVARQPETLKFIQDNNTSVSPGTLNLYIRKEVSTNEIGYEQIRNLQLNNLKIELIDNATGIWKDLSEVMPLSQFVSINDGDITVDFQSFYNFDYEGADEFNALASFRNSSGAIGFTYILTEEEEVEGEIESRVYSLFESVEFGFNNPWEVASFAQNANNITMALQNTGLVFDATGLNVVNGGFTIYDENKANKLLYIENGNLTMIGNIHANSGYFKGRIEADEGYFKGKIEADEGYFKGKIEADEGYFKGTITAAAGEIGGFKITEDSLNSKGSYTTQDGAVKPLIELKGEEGRIIAQNIELGTGAKISDYIELGDGRIRLNGKKNGTEILNFLSVKASNEPNAQEILSISDNGVIKVGEGDNYIVIDGGRGIMQSYNYSDSRGWQITNDETIFNNVTVRGSIKSSVLEYGEIQTVGGSILIRPSSRIKKIDPSYEQDGIYYTKIWLDDATSFAESSKQTREQEEKQYCIIKNAGTVYELYARPQVDENNNITEHSVVLVGQISSNLVNNPLVLLGKNGEVGIGINGSTIDGLLTPTSLSVFEFKKGENSAEFLPHIILGKLPTGEKYGAAAGTYGLYAENVRLTGSLVTQLANSNQAPVYSGISTQYSGEEAPTSEAYKQYFANESFGEILIWAGAEEDTKAGIEGSKFFVDRMGNLYASSGYFNGTIITDATITASELKTAKITGSGNGPALLIEDTFNGIHFNGIKDGTQKTSFEVSYSDFIVDVDSILLNKEVTIDSQGRVVAPAGYFTDGINGTFMDGKKIGFTSSFVKDNPWSSAINSSIRYDSGIEFYGNDKSIASMKIDNDGIKANLTRFNEDVEYGVNGEIKYRPAKDGDIIIGYDLFVG